MSFLLDTDTCSAYLKGHRHVWGRFMQYAGQLHISTISVGELHSWSRRAKAPPRRLAELQALLNEVSIHAVDVPVAEIFGVIRASLLDVGANSPQFDLMIAATAIVHNLTVVTHNVGDFQRIPGLRITDWLSQ